MSDRRTDRDASDVGADDLERYVATLSDEERSELAAAEVALDIAILLHRARERRGLSQVAAARLAGLQQQAVSRLERSSANPQFETVRAYLDALGYGVELHVIDLDTGEVALSTTLPPSRIQRSA